MKPKFLKKFKKKGLQRTRTVKERKAAQHKVSNQKSAKIHRDYSHETTRAIRVKIMSFKGYNERELLSTQETTTTTESGEETDLLPAKRPRILDINLTNGNFHRKRKPEKKPKRNEVLTGRFIPNRKLTNLDAHAVAGEIENVNVEDHEKDYSQEGTISIPKLYRNHILGIKNAVPENPLSYSYQNLLKFRQRLAKSPLTGTIVDRPQYPLVNEECSLLRNATRFRKIPKVPFKVLDAPALQDDFYLNLLDWSDKNVLTVGLGSCVYLWSADSSQVTKLCDLGSTFNVTSVEWQDKSHNLAIGTNKGKVQIWDTAKMKRIRVFNGHTARVGALGWQNNVLASGSRDKQILLRDLRQKNDNFRVLKGHKQEICGMKWSSNTQQLATGGNDNKLFVWNQHSLQPELKFQQHTAAVKAISWSTHQHGLLASGGGTADRTIRFFSTLTGQQLNCIDTGSQVCNLLFSKNANEIVSTHGYSLNQVIIWNYPTMERIAVLTGHTLRVLYLAISPDGRTIVTGAGDETLRFWNVFPEVKDNYESSSSLLQPICCNLR